MAASSSGETSQQKRYRAYVLFILVVIYTFNFLDRQIISILAIPIKEELGLNDTQLSLLGGLAFALFYTTLGIPIAVLADRWSRSWVVTIALTIWSAMTALCGLAHNFIHLFLARLGVGVGEAGGVAPSYSLIADYFPPEKHARALAIFSFGIPIGSALGTLLGGVLTYYINWRAAFIIVGISGLLIAPIFRLTVKEPQRAITANGGSSSAPKVSTAAGPPIPFKQIIAQLIAKKSFLLMALAAASAAMAGYGMLFWAPSFIVRSFGDQLPQFFSFLPGFLIPQNAGPMLYASYFQTMTLLLGGISGLWFSGLMADRLGQSSKKAYAMVPGFAFVAAVPLFFVGVLSAKLWLTFPCLLLIQFFSISWLGPLLSAVQHVVAPQIRATASAIFLFIVNLIGLGIGNLVIGLISDSLRAGLGDESLRYALLCIGGFYAVGAGLLYLASKHIDADWEK